MSGATTLRARSRQIAWQCQQRSLRVSEQETPSEFQVHFAWPGASAKYRSWSATVFLRKASFSCALSLDRALSDETSAPPHRCRHRAPRRGPCSGRALQCARPLARPTAAARCRPPRPRRRTAAPAAAPARRPRPLDASDPTTPPPAASVPAEHLGFRGHIGGLESRPRPCAASYPIIPPPASQPAKTQRCECS